MDGRLRGRGRPTSATTSPGSATAELRAGPAQAANLPAPKLEVVADATAGGERTLRLRLTPQRAARLATLHVDTSTATVLRAEVAGRPVPVEPREGKWGFGLVFHAPPTEGIEVTLTVRPDRRAGGVAGHGRQ